ncbi:thiamine pyrophosphate-binding protein [Falsiroseomonas selenitidurans]|uniref:Thiamine pyrophosphate-binding protein n=1 Tax=Falsiroseomonas selenitidurans TaxID=2716335 RepID=A0ABX1EC63_9PROT|nr:thiamine pyrophosphate-binding protein [Falsiroseomonas selenitidurans]NKC32500.1 thiamine pyrophosphate-binding protein [Falsiroseomonas selenitidurans]
MALRGADVLVKGLQAAGVRRIFTLSGNHIMEVFDALVGAGITLVHTRHEAAAVHMADAYARLSGEVGVALVTGGQGHANAVSALCSALAGEVPVLLLSGHAPLGEIGNGAFQELPQAALAAPITKASWAAQSAAGMAQDVARAFAIARSGRPGPVHLSLPTDVLEAKVEDAPVPEAAAFARRPMRLGQPAALLAAQRIAAASRPLLIAAPALCTPSGFAAMAALEAASGLPVVPMQSPRGLADPSLGAFPEVLAQADLVVLLGKPMDFTLKFGRAPATAPDCRWLLLEPEGELISRAQRLVGERLDLVLATDALEGATTLATVLRPVAAQGDWAARVREAVAWRPPEWAALAGAPEGPIRSATLGLAVNAAVAEAEATFICDGGEIGQWGLATVRAKTRIMNGVAGAIGVGIPFAIGARAALERPTIALMGDGSFGFHMAELDSAARHGLPFVAVVGNDSRWNAEHQIQLRDYGANRAHGCELAPGTRYDLIATALGGHGEQVTAAADLAPALRRALASGRPSVVNVEIAAQPAPSIRR